MIQDTSREAYEQEVKPILGERQSAVMDALRTREDFTNHELAEFLRWPINTVTPRVFELRQKKLVFENCRRLDKGTGRTAIAWKIVGQQSLV